MKIIEVYGAFQNFLSGFGLSFYCWKCISHTPKFDAIRNIFILRFTLTLAEYIFLERTLSLACNMVKNFQLNTFIWGVITDMGNVIDLLGKFCYYARNIKCHSDLIYKSHIVVVFRKYFFLVHARCIGCDAAVAEDPDRLQWYGRWWSSGKAASICSILIHLGVSASARLNVLF